MENLTFVRDTENEHVYKIIMEYHGETYHVATVLNATTYLSHSAPMEKSGFIFRDHIRKGVVCNGVDKTDCFELIDMAPFGYGFNSTQEIAKDSFFSILRELAFFKAWLEWAEKGAPLENDHGFNDHVGLCTNYDEYRSAHRDDYPESLYFWRLPFEGAYPFDKGESMYSLSLEKSKNPKRVEWVKNYIHAIEERLASSHIKE